MNLMLYKFVRFCHCNCRKLQVFLQCFFNPQSNVVTKVQQLLIWTMECRHCWSCVCDVTVKLEQWLSEDSAKRMNLIVKRDGIKCFNLLNSLNSISSLDLLKFTVHVEKKQQKFRYSLYFDKKWTKIHIFCIFVRRKVAPLWPLLLPLSQPIRMRFRPNTRWRQRLGTAGGTFPMSAIALIFIFTRDLYVFGVIDVRHYAEILISQIWAQKNWLN